MATSEELSAAIKDSQSTLADLNESLRVANQKLADTNPDFEANQSTIDSLSSEISKINAQIESTRQSIEELSKQKTVLDQEAAAEAQRAADAEKAADPTSTVKSPGATNEDQTAANTTEKYQKAEIVGDTSASAPGVVVFDDGSTLQTFDDGSTLATSADGGMSAPGTDGRITRALPKGAEPVKRKASQVKFIDVRGNVQNKDLRVKIRVPNSYLTSLTGGYSNELTNLGGIIFPYTPSISYENKADYASTGPLHSNYSINFYQRSSVGNISITGKFTVQDERDAAIYLSTVHLLKALTKMRSGGSTGDRDSGSPPPVCRLDAFGEFMLENVPVAISSFRVELPDSVDYFTIGKGATQNVRFGLTSVPTVSTIAITCIPMYSRDEMQKFSVSGWLTNSKFRKSGYL